MYSIISEDFDKTGYQIEAGVSNVSLLVNILVSVVNEMIVITLVVALSVIWKDHVACDSLQKRNYALSNYLLKVLPLNQGCEKLNKI